MPSRYFVQITYISSKAMYDKPMLSLEQAQSAIAAMIADYNRNPDR